MPRVKNRVLSASVSTCPGCGQRAPQRLVETAVTPGMSRLVSRGGYAPVTRAATCAACGDTYPVRADDISPAAAAERVRTPSGREWAYPDQHAAPSRTADRIRR